MTKERPILFSAPMVRAILEGRKTQTRRTVKPQPTKSVIPAVAHLTIGCDPSKDGAVWYDADCINPGREFQCPYGQPGDTLWVRETWIAPYVNTEIARYKADEPEGCLPRKWKPSIFMPRWASRISLRVTSVRVERLNDISDSDAKAEGVIIQDDAILASMVAGAPETPARMEYFSLWESIHGKGSWDENPWVWVIDFERVKP